jgi:Family of unknown function (DUF6152)
MQMRRWLPMALTLAACAAAAEAHHSLSGMYDQGRRITVDGTIAQFQFVNPHPFVMIDVADADGSVRSWKAELDNRRELVDIGMTATTIAPGDRVVVSGSPGRAQGPLLLYVWRMERAADGFLYEQIGTSPRVSRLRR